MHPDKVTAEVNTTQPLINDANPPELAEFLQGIYSALRTYANVHRGSGFNSAVTTYVFEQAREKILEHLGLSRKDYHVIFSTAAGAEFITNQLEPGSWQCLSSADLGLPVGVRAIAIKKGRAYKDIQLKTGGGTARLVSPDWVVWAKTPERFE
ncbi:MAG: hypothetical protein HY965_06910, partial [Ignavibacteriales bacterium]|nr:hypothetical protein [Ignavibacteriales bacterium]